MTSQVNSEAPQGSILFLIFIEDLIRKLVAVNDVSVIVYADDIKLFSSNPLKLQTALHTVENWSII